VFEPGKLFSRQLFGVGLRQWALSSRFFYSSSFGCGRSWDASAWRGCRRAWGACFRTGTFWGRILCTGMRLGDHADGGMRHGFLGCLRGSRLLVFLVADGVHHTFLQRQAQA
jgi:hypothetical protein